MAAKQTPATLQKSSAEEIKREESPFWLVPVFLDIGSSGGLSFKWPLAHRMALVRLIFVEPDPIEADRLRQSKPHIEILPFALWNTDGIVDLNVTRAPGCSSLLEPDLDKVRSLGRADEFEVVRREHVSPVAPGSFELASSFLKLSLEIIDPLIDVSAVLSLLLTRSKVSIKGNLLTQTLSVAHPVTSSRLPSLAIASR